MAKQASARRWSGALLTLACCSAQAMDFADVRIPRDATAQWVSEHMVLNGIHMQAIRFEVATPLSEVEGFYRRQWAGRMVRNEIGNRVVLGHAEGKDYITIQLLPSGGNTQGDIGIAKVGEIDRKYQRGARFPQPSGTSVLQDITYLDTSRPTRSLAMFNQLSPAQNAGFFINSHVADGYTVMKGTTHCGGAVNTCVAYLQKGESKVAMTFVRQKGGTSIVAVQM